MFFCRSGCGFKVPVRVKFRLFGCVFACVLGLYFGSFCRVNYIRSCSGFQSPGDGALHSRLRLEPLHSLLRALAPHVRPPPVPGRIIPPPCNLPGDRSARLASCPACDTPLVIGFSHQRAEVHQLHAPTTSGSPLPDARPHLRVVIEESCMFHARRWGLLPREGTGTTARKGRGLTGGRGDFDTLQRPPRGLC